MSLHDWTRVSAGTFHAFHRSWIVHMSESLNAGILPENYYAMPEQHAGQVNPDVLTLKLGEEASERGPGESIAVAEAPPQVSVIMTANEQATYRLARRTLTIRHSSDHRVVAMIEVVSPANKDRPQSVRDFVNKSAGVLARGYHLLVLDLLPSGVHDPEGMHGAIWDELMGQTYLVPEDRPLTLAAYVADALPRACVEPVRLDQTLPDMPLFIDTDHYVNVPLESTYQMAVNGMPAFWRNVLEA